MDKDEIKAELILRNARESLWIFNKLLRPKFFREDRPHLKRLANVLQKLYEGEILDPEGKPYRKGMICLPPRHGKSYSLCQFAQWILGKNPAERIISVSYGQEVGLKFSRYVRDGIDEQGTGLVYADVFPGSRIKKGEGSASCWSLDGHYDSYLGSSPEGKMTGYGASVALIDDSIKDAQQAMNDTEMDKLWSWYTDTFISRMEESCLQLLIGTRWRCNDLFGRLLGEHEDPAEKGWYVLNLPAMDADGNMLCPDLLSEESYHDKERLTASHIFRANFHQEPFDLQGCLYPSLKIYTNLPEKNCRGTFSYCDSANTGRDYCCNIVYKQYDRDIYIVDVLYTQDPMAITEPILAKMLYDNGVNKAKFESNSGGEGYSRAIKKILDDKHKDHKVSIENFHQSQNKEARILSNASYVQDHCYFPHDWQQRWPKFHYALTSFQARGKNKFDDAPDCLTGCIESIGTKKSITNIHIDMGLTKPCWMSALNPSGRLSRYE